MLIGSGICDAVGVFAIRDWWCVCEQAIAALLMATVAARTKVVSVSSLITVTVAFLISRWKC